MADLMKNDGNSAANEHDVWEPKSRASLVELLLTSGGDERIVIDPQTGRNRYGTPAAPASDEMWFSSSTASAISPAGYLAARRAYDALHSLNPVERVTLEDFFDGIRGDINGLYGSANSDVVLSASGTEGELLALALVGALTPRPITNIVLAPRETGSGVILAAQGRHFANRSCLGGGVDKGELLGGFDQLDVTTLSVPIRGSDGTPRRAEEIDMQVAVHAQQALLAGHAVLLHVLDTSKTGLSGLSRQMAGALTSYAPDHVFTVVDACQLRCAPNTIREDLKAGFMTLITGSKFAAGPPFSGALLLPRQILRRLGVRHGHGGAPRLPAGLSGYSAQLDWPRALRFGIAGNLQDYANLGLGLRWSAALAELKRLALVPAQQQGAIVNWFYDCVSHLSASSAHARLMHDGASADQCNEQTDAEPCKSLIPIYMIRRNGKIAGMDDVSSLHLALRHGKKTRGGATGISNDAQSRVMHVGQPVDLGQGGVLRLCLSAPMISDIADQMADGTSLNQAVAPMSRELAGLFKKWDSLVG